MQQPAAAVDFPSLCKREQVSIAPVEGTSLEQENAGGSHSQSMTCITGFLRFSTSTRSMFMVPVTFLRQRTSKLKVPGNNSPRFLDWSRFLRVPLLQTVATSIKFMTGAIMNNLMQSLILSIIATSGQLKQNSGMFRHGMSFDFHKMSK